jgi:hypothetical protein
LATIAALIGGLASSATAQTPTLLHHYQFDGNYDSATSNVVADALGTGTSVGTANGVSGGAAYFDGADDLLLLEGQGVLPAGAITLAFWEKADALSEISKGYFVCDAAANPIDNLYLRRRPSPVSAGSDVSAPNGKIGLNHFCQFGLPELSTEVWHQHTITYNASGTGYWWVDGQLRTVTPTGDPFQGLTAVVPGNSTYDRAGLVLGNRLDGNRQYAGYFDEVQIYQGSAHAGMAQHLYDNPAATLATYDPVANPDPGVADAPGVRPANAAVRRWKFDGDLDEEGGVAHGAAVGDAFAGTDNGVIAGSGAVVFDGNNDAVTISADVISTNRHSIALWSKDTSGTTGYLFCDEQYENLLMRRVGSGLYGPWAGGSDLPQFGDPVAEAAATYDEWHHIVFAVDGEWGNVRAYVDGSLAMTTNIETDWGDNDGFQELLGNLLYLGNRDDLGRDYAGLIDDLQIYNWNLSEADAVLLFENPGKTLAEIPEPSSLALLLAAILPMAARRRRTG